MKPDSIFRIASMTKPITSVALMMLVEEGKIQIDDPLSLYLPEFKELKVGVEKVTPETGKSHLVLEPPRREPTIQDLLRHTSGFTYDLFGDSLVKRGEGGSKGCWLCMASGSTRRISAKASASGLVQ
jgi:CubicO group peptidase (beta-lactamase class C family)